MKKRIMMIGLAVVLILGVLACINSMKKGRVDPTLKGVLNLPSVQKNLANTFDDTGVESAGDIGYTEEDDTLNITYGKYEFYIYKDTYDDDDIKKALNKLHLKVKKTDEGKYRLYYGGEVVKRWAE